MMALYGRSSSKRFHAAVASSTDEPVYVPATDTILVQDDMESYTTLTAMGATPLGSAYRLCPQPSPVINSTAVDSGKNAIVTPGRDGTGQCLRVIYSGVPQEDQSFISRNTPTSPAGATNFFRFWVRYAVPSLGVNTLAIKNFEMWHVNVAGRLQFCLHDNAPWPLGANPDRHTYWQVYNNSTNTSHQGTQPIGPYFNADINNSGWHRYTFAEKPHSAVGARDGFARMWLDGTKIIDISQTTVGVTPTGGEKEWCLQDDVDALSVNDPIGEVRFGEVETSAGGNSWTYDFDDFLWWYR